MGIGRPKKNLRPEDYGLVEALTAEGLTQLQIARKLGMSVRTFSERMKDDPAVAEAVAQGRAVEQGELVGILRQMARNGDAQSAMFLLRCRHGFSDRGGGNDSQS